MSLKNIIVTVLFFSLAHQTSTSQSSAKNSNTTDSGSESVLMTTGKNKSNRALQVSYSAETNINDTNED